MRIAGPRRVVQHHADTRRRLGRGRAALLARGLHPARERDAEVAEGRGAPDPNRGNLASWCLQCSLVNVVLF